MSRHLDVPFHVGGAGRVAVTDDDDHVRDMIFDVLFTNPGERVNRPGFGSGLLQMVFAPNTPEVATALQFSLQADLQRWLGDLIELQALEVTSIDSSLLISIQYLVRRSNESKTEQFTLAA